jgi:sialic acid synthase SpsE
VTSSPATPLLIAEIGVNHDGSVDRAMDMVTLAAAAGFDVVKFQYWILDELLAADTPNAPYQGDGDQRSLLEPLELTLSELDRLHECAREAGVQFCVTPDGERAFEQVATLAPELMKVGSGDADNPWLLEKVASFAGPVLLSTGMMTDGEVVAAVGRLDGVDDLTVLHCVSAYPTHLAEVDLGRMGRLRDLIARPVGFSDHTIGVAAPAAAVALGAVAVEKHVTWSLDADGPDHRASLELSAAAAWCSTLREIAVGVHEARAAQDQEMNRPLVRKGLYLTTDLRRGATIGPADVAGHRPVLDGVPVHDRDQIVGRRVRRDLAAGSLLSPSDLA